MAVFLISLIQWKVIGNVLRKPLDYQVTVFYMNNQVTFKAMLDTGNALYSVLGRKPVIVADRKAVEPLLSSDAAGFLRKYDPNYWVENLPFCADEAWLARVQIIPCRSVGGSSMMLGFIPDMVQIITTSKTIQTSEVVVGIYNGMLSSDNHYAALLHPAVFGYYTRKEVATCVSPG